MVSAVDDTSASVGSPVWDPLGRIIPIPVAAMFDDRIKPTHLQVMLFMAYQSEHARDGWFEVRQIEVARFFGKEARGAVSTLFGDLDRWGYIVKSSQTHATSEMQRANRYRMVYDISTDDIPSDHRRAVPDPQLPAPKPVPTNQLALFEAAKSPVTLGESAVTLRESPPTPNQSPGFPADSQGVTGGSLPVTLGESPPTPNQSPGNTGFQRSALVRAEDGELITTVGVLEDSEVEESEDEDRRGGSQTSAKTDAPTLIRLFTELAAKQGIVILSDIAPSAEAFGGQLTEEQAKLVISQVFGRLTRDGVSEVRSFAVVRKTWSSALIHAGKSISAMEAWLGGHEQVFERFCALYPAHASDNLRSDATRRALLDVLNRGIEPDALLESVRHYASTLEGRRARRAAAWLSDGEWRPASVAPVTTVALDGMTPWDRIRQRAECLPSGLARLLDKCAFRQASEQLVLTSASAFTADQLRKHSDQVRQIAQAEFGPEFGPVNITIEVSP